MVSIGTLIGQSNLNLHHTCDFTIDLKLQVCNEMIMNITESIRMTIAANLKALLEARIPFLNHILNIYRTLKSWYDTIMRYVKQIAQFIKCISDIIAAIKNFVDTLMTLPARILSQITGCIRGLRGMVEGAANKLMSNGLTSDVSSFVSKIQSDISEVKGSIQGSFNKAKTALETDNVTSSYESAISGFGDELTNVKNINIGQPVIDSIVKDYDTVKTKIGSIKTAVEMP
jgi:hypothetical protein